MPVSSSTILELVLHVHRYLDCIACLMASGLRDVWYTVSFLVCRIERPSSDIAFCGILSGSTLFANVPFRDTRHVSVRASIQPTSFLSCVYVFSKKHNWVRFHSNGWFISLFPTSFTVILQIIRNKYGNFVSHADDVSDMVFLSHAL